MLNCCLKPFYILQQIQTNILNLSKFHNCQNLRWICYRDGFAAVSNQHDHHRGRLERRPEQIWAELQRQKCIRIHSDGCSHYVWKQWRSTCKFFLNDRHFISLVCSWFLLQNIFVHFSIPFIIVNESYETHFFMSWF